ncbi:type VI secretion system protein TssA [Photobacterium kagoshimensis]|uniref:type VI secretion system protein TssA n=1 Tax=Photobacterium kagoshimensis TaxID=2910242 RepID=UPI003D11E202
MAIFPFEQSAQIDLTALSVAITPERPCGEDPRHDTSPSSVYYQLKNVRNNARTLERNALIDGEPLLSFSNQWGPLIEQVPALLLNETKDLEFTAWYIEALIRTYGYAGLNHGFMVAKLLIEQFWDGLYPWPDEDGVETRVAPLIGLNGIEGEGTLLMPISCIPITEFDGDRAYALWEYEQACEVDRLETEKKRHRIDQGAIELSVFESAVSQSSGAFYAALVSDIENCISSYQQLVTVMDQASGLSLPTSHIAKRLQAALDAVKHIAADQLRQMNEVTQSQEEVETDSESLSDEQPQPSTNLAEQQLRTRQDAILQLKTISDFFRKTEPHSPMSYAIDQVVRWSDLALPDLLAELIDDGSARQGYFRLVGISSENDTSS